MTEVIKRSEVKYSSGSMCDRMGRVFFWKGRVFREINKNYEDRIRAFLSSELFASLTAEHFIPRTWIADCVFDNSQETDMCLRYNNGGGMLIEHERVQPSAPSDWSFSMLKDAALFLLNLNSFLKSYGYNLWDGHLWNVCFHNNRPMLIDFGSLVPIEAGSCFESDFIHTCGYPLMLFSQNESYLAKSLLSSPSCIYQRTIPSQKIENSAAIRECLYQFFKHIKFANRFRKTSKLERKFLKPAFIQKHMNFKMLERTMWDEYQNDFFKDFINNKLNERFARFEDISNLIARHCPDAESLVDLAGNQGALCYYLEQKIPALKNLINLDYDEKAIDTSYKFLKEHSSKIHTIVGNFMLPIHNNFKEVYQCDVALALAVTHHLTLAQGFHLSAVFETIKSYSNKYVFIEFMPWGLWGGGERPEVPEWYNFNWFKETFERYFTLLHVEDFGNNRILFIGKNKEK